MLLSELISRLQGIAARYPEIEVTVAGNDGPSHWVGPPNSIVIDLVDYHEVHIEYNPRLEDEP